MRVARELDDDVVELVTATYKDFKTLRRSVKGRVQIRPGTGENDAFLGQERPELASRVDGVYVHDTRHAALASSHYLNPIGID